MLDYAPDCLPGDSTSLYGREWGAPWTGETVLPDDNLVSRLIERSREAVNISRAKPAIRVPQTFNPERMSGYCAS